MRRFAVRPSPLYSAGRSILASSFRVGGDRVIRIPRMASPSVESVFARPYTSLGFLSSSNPQPQKLFRKVYSSRWVPSTNVSISGRPSIT